MKCQSCGKPATFFPDDPGDSVTPPTKAGWYCESCGLDVMTAQPPPGLPEDQLRAEVERCRGVLDRALEEWEADKEELKRLRSVIATKDAALDKISEMYSDKHLTAGRIAREARSIQ